METTQITQQTSLLTSQKILSPGKIYEGDCIALMRGCIADNSINMIYADPPYNASHRPLSLTNNKTGGAFFKINESWDSFNDQDYMEFSKKWLTEAHRVLDVSGSLFVACSMHNIGEVVICAKMLGFKQNNIIVWRKPNAMPNITKRTFTHTTEYTCWFVKGKGWTFNYHDLKKINPLKAKDGSDKQMPDFIELPLVQGAERISAKDTGRALHPTQKPERLIEIFVTATTMPGDIVLDPFMGSGTTAVVADRTDRQWIGIEMESRYISEARKRICRAHQS